LRNYTQIPGPFQYASEVYVLVVKLNYVAVRHRYKSFRFRQTSDCPPRFEVEEHPGQEKQRVRHCWFRFGRPSQFNHRHNWHSLERPRGNQKVWMPSMLVPTGKKVALALQHSKNRNKCIV